MKSRWNLLLQNMFLFFCGSIFSSSFISQNVSFMGEVTINDSCFVSNDPFIQNLTALGTINIEGKIDFLVENNQDNVLTIGSQNKNFQIFIKDLPIYSSPKKFLSLDADGRMGVRDSVDFFRMHNNVDFQADFETVLVNEIDTNNDTLVIQNVNNAENPIDILIGNPAANIFLIGDNIYINASIDSHNAQIIFQKPVLVNKDLLTKTLLVNGVTILESFYPQKDIKFLSNSGLINNINSNQTISLKGKVIFKNQLVLAESLLWESLQAAQPGSFPYLTLNGNNQVAYADSSFSLNFGKNIAVNNFTVENLYTSDSKQCLVGNTGDIFLTVAKEVSINQPLLISAPAVFLQGVLFFDTLQIGNVATFNKLKFSNIPANGWLHSCKASQFVIDSSINMIKMNKDNLSIFTNFFLGYAVLEKNSADNSLSLKILKTATVPATVERRSLESGSYEPYIDILLDKTSDMSDLSIFGLGLAQVIHMYQELADIRNQYDSLMVEKKQLKQAYIEKKEKLVFLKKIIKGI